MGSVVDWECQVEYRRVIHRNDKRYSERKRGVIKDRMEVSQGSIIWI